MIFSLASVPLVLAVGGTIDYSRAALARSQMQDALDAAALAMSKTVRTLTSDQLNQQAVAYFNANFNAPGTKNITVTPVYTSTKTTLTLDGSLTVDTYFLPLIGIETIPINTTSTVTWGTTRLRVALVLDTTGSMDQSGKMTALKQATHNLLNQLESAAGIDGDVYVSIVPFVKDVNVGASQYAQSWIDWTDWDAANGNCSVSGSSSKSSCQSNGTCSNSYFNGNKTWCLWYGYSWTAGTWTPKSHSTWNGCITDRTQDYDTKNTAPTSTATNFPAEQYGSCPAQLTGLTYDWSALSTLVDSMSPNGNTNQAIGLAWGWQSLTQSPFTIPAYDPDYTYKRIIILLSDGMNTENRWSTSQSSIDVRQKLLCDTIKADTTDDITLYMVQVNTGSDPTSSVLQYCATDAAHFFLLTSADQIVTTFDEIGTALSSSGFRSRGGTGGVARGGEGRCPLRRSRETKDFGGRLLDRPRRVDLEVGCAAQQGLDCLDKRGHLATLLRRVAVALGRPCSQPASQDIEWGGKENDRIDHIKHIRHVLGAAADEKVLGLVVGKQLSDASFLPYPIFSVGRRHGVVRCCVDPMRPLRRVEVECAIATAVQFVDDRGFAGARHAGNQDTLHSSKSLATASAIQAASAKTIRPTGA